MLRKYLEEQINTNGCFGQRVRGIKKIRGEASSRFFYRVYLPGKTRVAMVYPVPAAKEIAGIVRLTDVYRHHGLHVAAIETIMDERVILMEDLGDTLVQKAFSNASRVERDKIIEQVGGILTTLRQIERVHTAALLDTARMKWEMDFFITYFAGHYLFSSSNMDEVARLKEQLHGLVEQIGPVNTFAHRDFHSRNMLYLKDNIYLVDFQDSLIAPADYDLVSFAFDAYLDLKGRRGKLLECLRRHQFQVDEEQYCLTALQRNIKALGTFGFQVNVKKNLAYKKYMNRTIKHIQSNPLLDRFSLENYFNLDIKKCLMTDNINPRKGKKASAIKMV